MYSVVTCIITQSHSELSTFFLVDNKNAFQQPKHWLLWRFRVTTKARQVVKRMHREGYMVNVEQLSHKAFRRNVNEGHKPWFGFRAPFVHVPQLLRWTCLLTNKNLALTAAWPCFSARVPGEALITAREIRGPLRSSCKQGIRRCKNN